MPPGSNFPYSSHQSYGGQAWPHQTENNIPRKEEKKFRYYKLEQQVTIEDLYWFSTFHNSSHHNKLVNKIRDYKEQQMTKSASAAQHYSHTNNRPTYNKTPLAMSYDSSQRQIPGPRINQNSRAFMPNLM